MDRPAVSRIVSLADEREEALHASIGALRAGELVVFPTDTVYGLAADAFIGAATARVFEVKQRPRSLPLPVLVSRPKQAWALASRVPPAAEALAEAFWPGALTLILPQGIGLDWDLGDSGGTIAVRIPAHDDLLALLEMTGPVAATSANQSGRPTPPTIDRIRAELGDAVAVYVDGGPARAETGSTIVDLAGQVPTILREGPIPAGDVRTVIATG